MSMMSYHVKRIRVQSGVSQADVAAKLGMTPSRLSRLESGEIVLSFEEGREILQAIESPEAREFLDYLETEWKILPNISFDHPDWRLLQQTDEMLAEVLETKKDPDLRAVFAKRLDLYAKELGELAEYIESPRHTLAFIGAIGVGKTTAICEIAGMLLEGEKNPQKRPVLEVGGGGTTICEVIIKPAPKFGLIVEPRSEEDLNRDVHDFASFLLARASSTASRTAADTGDELVISREIERAIRNMARLQRSRSTSGDGTRVVEDPAMDLVRKLNDKRELVIEILNRMDLPRRDQRSIWCPEEEALAPWRWLQRTFAEINNGRNPDFSLPKRMEVAVPYEVLRTAFSAGSQMDAELHLDLTIIDTKGVDQTAERADLECHFYDSRTVVVLCSGFRDAPEECAQTLLRRAVSADAPMIEHKSLVLVLSQGAEASEVKDEYGMYAESSEDGYALKSEQVELRLNGIGLPGLGFSFFNSHTESSEGVRADLLRTVQGLREYHKERLGNLLSRVRGVIDNRADAQRAEVMKSVSNLLLAWTRDHRKLPDVNQHVQDSLLSAIRKAHASSVRAALTRKGDWRNLDYYHHLGHGARTVLAQMVADFRSEFRAVVDNLKGTEDFDLAVDFLEQVGDVFSSGTQQMLAEMQIAGPEAFAEDLENAAPELWLPCLEEWGKGPGFREKVRELNSVWFEGDGRKRAAEFLKNFAQESWESLIDEVEEILSTSLAEE